MSIFPKNITTSCTPRNSRIIFPILLGLAAVSYLFWKHFDPKEFSRIQWTSHTVVWIGVAAALSIIWHLSYAYRLRALTKKNFPGGNVLN
ncbi:MAG: hypothetical protein IPH16_01290 [Haliscomenobacter sp.]|nr:hypothetical protein [Haliscomenobacter sp.]